MNRFKNFSESGSKAITAAVNIAGKMGHITVGTEHLLIGVLTSGKSDVADPWYTGDFETTYPRYSAGLHRSAGISG